MRWIANVFAVTCFSTPLVRVVICLSDELVGHCGRNCNSVDDITAFTDSSQEPQVENNNDSNSCTLYMAPSYIPNAGYGVFTVKSFNQVETILANDGPNIPVVDPTIFGGPHIRVFDNVWWGETGGMSDAMKFEAEEMTDFQIMFGALPNYHTFLHNLGHYSPAMPLDDTLADRTVDPGAGAFSYYLGKDFFARRAIEAGEEIFLDYGENWLDVREEFKQVPRKSDFDLGGQLLSNFSETWDTLILPLSKNRMDQSEEEALLNMIISDIHKTASEYGGSRAASVLPKHPQELKRILMSATSFDPKELSYRLARELSVQKRSVEWIKSNGLCLDNIVPGKSNIAGAGRGAFAARKLKEGQLIVPTPLLHVTDRDVFDTFHVQRYHFQDTNERLLQRDHTETTGSQLLVNYCMGHDESSLLLCPVTNMVLINHCSAKTKQCGEQRPNAMYRWATDWDENTKVWLNRTIKEMEETKEERLLSLEIVATRDIEEGEEIFIDYGEGWEDAWDHHVADWKPPTPNDGRFEPHISATEMNSNRSPPYVTHDLRNDHSGSPNDVTTLCWYHGHNNNSKLNHTEREERIDFNWREFADDEILARYSIDGRKFVRKDPRHEGWFWPCSIIEKDGDDAYLVRIFQLKSHPQTEWDKKGLPLFLRNLPRESIQYVTKPYRSDMHVKGVFRHHIEIRDEIFPKQWKNRPRTLSSRSSKARFFPGDRVEAVSEKEGWSTGKVTRVTEGAVAYDIVYNSGSIERGVSPAAVKPNNCSANEKYASLQTYEVGHVVYGNFGRLGNWLQGTIANVTSNSSTRYDIKFDDGDISVGQVEALVRPIYELRDEVLDVIPFLS